MKDRKSKIFLLILLLPALMLASCSKDPEKPDIAEETQTAILEEFIKISEIPRNNGDDMSKISSYIVDKAAKLGLETKTDKAGNIMIEKPATTGYKDSPTGIIQTNIDMIAKAKPSVIFDPKEDGIIPIVDDNTGRISGTNTSLGASSGLGISTAFYVLEHATSHGAIKAVFTMDGAGSYNGAKEIDPSFLDGDFLINLNNDRFKDIETGSAYSAVATCDRKIAKVKTKNKFSFVLVADGFPGGDSGISAQSGQYGNPIMFMSEVLVQARNEGLTYEINDFTGGEKVSAIPTSAKAVITVNDYEKSKIASIFDDLGKDFLNKYSDNAPDAKLSIIETTVPDKALKKDAIDSLNSFLYSIIDGKYFDKENTFASSNVGSVLVESNRISCDIFIQSKVKEALDKMIADHSQIAKISNMEFKLNDMVDGYYTDRDSFLVTELLTTYKKLTNNDVELSYKTTRSELGFLQQKNPYLSIVSIGPEVMNQGKTNEQVKLNTVGTSARLIIGFLTDQKE